MWDNNNTRYRNIRIVLRDGADPKFRGEIYKLVDALELAQVNSIKTIALDDERNFLYIFWRCNKRDKFDEANNFPGYEVVDFFLDMKTDSVWSR